KIWACGMFEHLCLMFVCLWSGIWRGGFAWDKSFLQFNWHPVLMVTSLVMLYGNAMVLYRVPLKWSRWWCKLTHAGLLFVAVLLSVLGVYAAFHTANNIPHLYLLHSWTGTSTVALFTLQVYINYSMKHNKNKYFHFSKTFYLIAIFFKTCISYLYSNNSLKKNFTNSTGVLLVI
uniref:Lysosomal membrane ascorbate-dependent ferrireductase CYB561A3 n=1 Tax=Cyprinus carpio TaxID=7962 RepID=A0A8C2BZP8_CYPCA